ncbi:hypothetical protein ASPWEDRAFT_170078 [Aspergillus wentii DTO 134E9]|uniref:Uncharacterized protein n=1 Tax=Aspergillus wentii DTO 134E9 TaxID=1073089 RepID=A0A1L9RP03_ASPWE|nr:uncharacterized protein ASPWEDRAFT_170078 [Aspergillus wentii DTO 134E9]KAI9934296.1 hypothetical protein MW887_005370 [Aspergillus wentii]OJJ36567.1 hypothetical protein ASPWEDRAFT_170078 [Aspergillus wentii DTO 134E9]
MSTTSPFRISARDLEDLERNDAFRTIREHLKRQEQGMHAPSFCATHRHSCSSQDQESFRLHRDIIHTLLLPLFLLHNQASRIASSVLPSQRASEPERAFRGEARSAYAWLHCILTEEHDWYLTERCPACIVLHALHSEPTIRFVAVACLLSDHLQDLGFLNARNRLPAFEFWLEALETAVCEDPFWGNDFWPEIEYRACGLTDGVKQLVLQCMEMRTALERQSLQAQSSYGSHYRAEASRQQQVHTIAAKKQARMTGEEPKRLSKVVVNCYMQSNRPQRFHRRSVTS